MDYFSQCPLHFVSVFCWFWRTTYFKIHAHRQIIFTTGLIKFQSITRRSFYSRCNVLKYVTALWQGAVSVLREILVDSAIFFKTKTRGNNVDVRQTSYSVNNTNQTRAFGQRIHLWVLLMTPSHQSHDERKLIVEQETGSIKSRCQGWL